MAKYTFERLEKIPKSLKPLIKNTFPKKLQAQSAQIDDVMNKLSEEILAKRLAVYVIRKSKVAYALVWVDIINDNAQIKIQFSDGLRKMSVEQEILLLIKDDLLRQRLASTYTGYFLIDNESQTTLLLKQLSSHDIPAQVRVDLELILKKDNSLLSMKLDKPVGKIKSWNKKYLEAVTNLDFRAYQGLEDMKVMPELFSNQRHIQFMKSIVQGEIGPIIKKASQVIFLNNRCIGVLITTRLSHITALISILSIDPDFQRQGYGSYLLKYALQKLWKAKIPRVLCSISRNNEAANHLAEAFDFKEFQSHIDYLMS